VAGRLTSGVAPNPPVFNDLRGLRQTPGIAAGVLVEQGSPVSPPVDVPSPSKARTICPQGIAIVGSVAGSATVVGSPRRAMRPKSLDISVGRTAADNRTTVNQRSYSKRLLWHFRNV
jgi:hypothetical protein